MNTKSAKKPAKVIAFVLYFAGLSLLLGLGTWQLLRGLEKAAIEAEVASKSSATQTRVDGARDWQELLYSNVQLEGRWMVEKSLLLDNRIFKGQKGVEVLSPFRLMDDTVIFINRGWIPDPRGSILNADLVQPTQDGLATGKLYVPGSGFTLGPAYTQSAEFPVIIQYFDASAISDLLGLNVARAVLVEQPAKQGFEVIWKPYVVNAQRHYGYAFQWWGLSLVMIIFGLIWQFKVARK